MTVAPEPSLGMGDGIVTTAQEFFWCSERVCEEDRYELLNPISPSQCFRDGGWEEMTRADYIGPIIYRAL